MPSSRAVALAVLLALAATLAPSHEAAALPAFARKYRVSCALCHNPMPALTAFGEQFAANGFRMSPTEEPRDTIGTGDELLTLPAGLPLALRLDGYAQLYADGKAATDFQLPFNVKLLSGGTLSKKLSYYIYFLLSEEGGTGLVEDAFLYVNDIRGAPVDLTFGQFQVSDPIYKRELRLEVQDYAIYKTLVGLQPANLTYERGFMASADLAGFGLTASLVNGDGIPPADEALRFDNDAHKNLFGHLARDFGEHVRLGVLGYTGAQSGDPYGFPDQRNTISMFGADATFGSGPIQLNLQYVSRKDTEANFVAGEPTVYTDGGFAELLVRPAGKRWYAYGLYNYIEANQPVLHVNLGGPADVDRYEAIAVGSGFLVYRNFRLYGEYGYVFDEELNRVTAGFTTAF
jgi:hypothetical protein